MGKTFYKYDLFNTRENSLELVGVTLDEISQYTLTPKCSILRYVNTEHVYKNQYKFYREEVDEEAEKDGERMPPKLRKEWGEIFKAAELIRTGKGYITEKLVNGKWVKYTEVIR